MVEVTRPRMEDMNKSILILKGSPRERGNSASLAGRVEAGALAEAYRRRELAGYIRKAREKETQAVNTWSGRGRFFK